MKLKVIIPVILVMFCICLITIFVFFRGNSEGPRAIILDNLGLYDESLSGKDITFVQETKELLEGIGVKVDYIGVGNVKLEVYRNLAKYNLVILRVHSGLLIGDGMVCFFTSEPLPENLGKYSEWFNKGYLVNATLELRDGTKKHFIGVKPDFISNCLNGEFENSIIIAMGCNSLDLESYSMAKAFVDDRKALVYIGWTRDVTADYTDNATLELLKRFFQKNQTVKEAIEIKRLRDPKTGAVLKYYPASAAELCPKEIIEQLLEKKSSFISDLIDSFSWVLLVTLSASNWFDSCYRRFLRKF